MQLEEDEDAEEEGTWYDVIYTEGTILSSSMDEEEDVAASSLASMDAEEEARANSIDSLFVEDAVANLQESSPNIDIDTEYWDMQGIDSTLE